jgi:hypothetical protein
MADFQRFEQLSEKLGHPLYDVRLRSAKNILSKAQAGILGSVISSASCILSLSGGIKACLDIIIDESTKRDIKTFSEPNEIIIVIANIAKYLGSVSTPASVPADSFAEVLDRLYALDSFSHLETSVRAIVKEVT